MISSFSWSGSNQTLKLSSFFKNDPINCICNCNFRNFLFNIGQENFIVYLPNLSLSNIKICFKYFNLTQRECKMWKVTLYPTLSFLTNNLNILIPPFFTDHKQLCCSRSSLSVVNSTGAGFNLALRQYLVMESAWNWI